MLTTLLGSCRLRSFGSLLPCTSINETVSYVHSTKEALQLISFVKGSSNIPKDMTRYVFRSAIMKREPLEISQEIVQQFEATDLFIIEICSRKVYLYNDLYLHHLAVDNRWDWDFWKETPKHISSGTVIKEQSREEIEKDIEDIVDVLHGKRVIFVAHILPPNSPFSKRKELIEVLDDICRKKRYDLIMPTACYVEGLMSFDLGHYDPLVESSVVLPYFKKRLTEIGVL